MVISSVLMIGAHPDDETMLAGGTLAFLASQGIAVHILCATRGEGGELGEPPVCKRSEIGLVRENELRCAAARLGVTGIRFLQYVDPLIGPDELLYPFDANAGTLNRQLYHAIKEVEADLVLTHGRDGEYGHPAHILLHQATKAAIGSMSAPPLLYTLAAKVPGIEDRIWNDSEPAHFALDIGPWLDVKEAAALCHVSQHALFRRRRGTATIREALRAVESFHRHCPPVHEGNPKDPFANLLQAAGAWTPFPHDRSGRG